MIKTCVSALACSLGKAVIERQAQEFRRTHVPATLNSFTKFIGAEKDWGLQLFENQMVRSLVDSCALVPYGIPEIQCILKGKATIAAISLESAPGGSVSEKVDTLEFADGTKLTDLRETQPGLPKRDSW